MKEKHHSKKHKKHKKHGKHKSEKKKNRQKSSSDSSSGSDTDNWVEKPSTSMSSNRDDWMSMTGMLKTYTKDDIREKREEKEKKTIDSYNPATSSRELNPYWKQGGTGVPQTSQEIRTTRQFIKPSNDFGFTRKSTGDYKKEDEASEYRRSYNWKSRSKEEKYKHEVKDDKIYQHENKIEEKTEVVDEPVSKPKKTTSNLYLSDEKMNKLGAKIVKAEIMGDTKLVDELKAKLEAAREYRKNNPDAGPENEEDNIMLMSTSSTGNTRPLMKPQKNIDSGKRKAKTHDPSGRTKYFASDDQYDLNEMFQQEKYGSNYDEDAELAKIAGKSKNPNDDLEDIFLDEITKNKSNDAEKERQRAIKQHTKLEKCLEGCEHCIDSKNMLKHLIITCGKKVYMALPARRSLVKGHCLITTLQHSTCVTGLDEDIWEEILNYRKMITQFYNQKNHDVVFYETATRLHRFPHMVINCVPLPRDVGDMASIYFKKALLECEAEWSMNKKVVELKGKNIRKGVPKGLPYFWIDFGMDPGFAHIIEDQQLFPKNFAEEIIGGMLDLDHTTWKNPQKEYGDLQRKKVLEFLQEWKPFEKSFSE
ncbi:CWF19-like protein 2 homolog [Aricia agestis]|uniref:CWF19-like protein 2 homolog n=1 Tax=Aricia agestis TaxID=91739 RepID=UPI001C203AAD|nr:CWF19-like protein 2 homolog [Aricia agestis]